MTKDWNILRANFICKPSKKIVVGALIPLKGSDSVVMPLAQWQRLMKFSLSSSHTHGLLLILLQIYVYNIVQLSLCTQDLSIILLSRYLLAKLLKQCTVGWRPMQRKRRYWIESSDSEEVEESKICKCPFHIALAWILFLFNFYGRLELLMY